MRLDSVYSLGYLWRKAETFWNKQAINKLEDASSWLQRNHLFWKIFLSQSNQTSTFGICENINWIWFASDNFKITLANWILAISSIIWQTWNYHGFTGQFLVFIPSSNSSYFQFCFMQELWQLITESFKAFNSRNSSSTKVWFKL